MLDVALAINEVLFQDVQEAEELLVEGLDWVLRYLLVGDAEDLLDSLLLLLELLILGLFEL